MDYMDYDKSKVIVALDNYSVPMAEEIIAHWQNKVYGFKLNHNLYPYIGKKYNNIFCDYKLYDIPNTMEGIIENLIADDCDMVTVHVTNNKSAIESLKKYSDKIKLLGVSVLTSWNYADVDKVFRSTVEDIYNRTICLMEDNGFYGMICSAQDLLYTPKTSLKKVCPGIRSGASDDDQVRITTPQQAFENGADYLVMGRSFFK